MHRAVREIMIRSRHPKTRFRGPVHLRLVRQIDDAGSRETAQDHPFHGADEGPAMAEIGGHCDHTAGNEMFAHDAVVLPMRSAHAPVARLPIRLAMIGARRIARKCGRAIGP